MEKHVVEFALSLGVNDVSLAQDAWVNASCCGGVGSIRAFALVNPAKPIINRRFLVVRSDEEITQDIECWVDTVVDTEGTAMHVFEVRVDA